jgi:uncharacterized protein YbjT (DUF2867 family)
MEARTTNPPILVTGGTGTLGRLVVARLRQAGRDVRVLSRGKRELPHEIKESGVGVEFVSADLATEDGVDAAVQGAEIIIHLVGSAKRDEDKARHLIQAASRSEAKHVVYISVVGDERIPVVSGIDRAMFGYFASKLAAERAIADSGVPWTTLHVTQLYDLTFLTVQAMAKLPVIPVPAGFKFQPIDAGEVADRLVGLAVGAPAGLVPDMAGPRVYEMADLVRSYLRAVGKRRLLIPVWMPGGAARAFREGANLAPDRAVGRLTWEEFLAARVGSPSDSRLSAV